MFFRILLSLSCFSIAWSNVSSQIIESNSNREKMFVFEVKHIDEFIERFNNEERSLIISFVKMNYPGIVIDRASLVTNLFNLQKKTWVKKNVDSFFNQVTNKENPVYLDFYSKNWFAEALCSFKYKGKPADVVLILMIQQESNGGSKWVIMSASSRYIPPAKKSITFLSEDRGMKFLNPMSHATNFMSLSTALYDKQHIWDYLDTGFVNYSSSKSFLQALLKNQLEYQYVKQITYHFLQVNGWIFTVDRFRRKSINSGWLISKLWEATDESKIVYLDSLLHKDPVKVF